MVTRNIWFQTISTVIIVFQLIFGHRLLASEIPSKDQKNQLQLSEKLDETSLYNKVDDNMTMSVEVYNNKLPSEVLNELDNNENSELIEITNKTANSDLDVKISNIKNELGSNWWLKKKDILVPTWSLLRFIFGTGVTYLALVTFSGLSPEAIINGTLVAGAMSIYFIKNTIKVSLWIVAKPTFLNKLARSIVINILYLSILKIGIDSSEIFLAKTPQLQPHLDLLKSELLVILKGALISSLTHGAWGLWIAQKIDSELKVINSDNNTEELENDKEVRRLRSEIVTVKAHFYSFINSVVNNSLASLTAMGGDQTVAIANGIVSAS